MRRQSPHDSRHSGFTLVELLVAVTLIIVLISLLIVALNQTQKAAQRANTRVLMNSISQALVQFREDTGYLPPVLDNDRALFDPPALNVASYDTAVQDWYSMTSLAEFLIGYGNEQEDGFGLSTDVTKPSPGIRNPGPDGVWGATRFGTADGSLGARNQQSAPGGLGEVYGPYLQLDNPRLIASVDFSGPIPVVLFPGDNGYDDPANPRVIVDYWGNPIQFYRRAYPRGALSQSYRANVDRNDNGSIEPEETRIPSLSDVVMLRPQQAPENAIVPGAVRFDGDPIDLTTYSLQTAEFALFSPGPDRRFNASLRVDQPELFNADNIVELGK